MFTGSFTALITPFNDGQLDETEFQNFVEWQISEGTQGLVPVGTTGESPTLSHGEHERVIDLCLEVARGRVPVIAGAGSNATAEAISLASHAKRAGADAVLSVTPYYNKPNQAGLYAHYKAIADAVDIPIIIYVVPPRTNVDVTVETMARLAADCPNIVGMKDATADLTRPLALRNAIGDPFCLMSGEDATIISFLANGGDGCISVTSNVAPRLCADMHAAWAADDRRGAAAINEKLFPLHHALFLEPSPQGVKYAALLLGKGRGEVRLPLVELGNQAKKAVEEAMQFAGLI
ncbi:MAG: 4-hydroxy-tetrahydrodipicolinate synthase [Alphaproteobacteria bacterium]|nr:4-hydroxy-tetrahydrodipicolinate synthase [Alphaproteobacteria bacterium]